MKRCTKCGLDKDEDDFHLCRRNDPTKRRAQCKVCTNKDNTARQAADPQKYNARTTAWRAKNPGRASQISRDWQLRHPKQFKAIVYRGRYNVDFEALWQAQDGLCAVCHKPMLKEGKDPLSVCVDHDRTCCSGKKSCGKCVRGLIHRNCNLVLGYAKDDASLLRAAAAFLDEWDDRFSVHKASTGDQPPNKELTHGRQQDVLR